MKNKTPEEYKEMMKKNQFTVSLSRDLMACVDIFKTIPCPESKAPVVPKTCMDNHDSKSPTDRGEDAEDLDHQILDHVEVEVIEQISQ